MLSQSSAKEAVAPLPVSRIHVTRRKRIPHTLLVWAAVVSVLVAIAAVLAILPFQFPSTVQTIADITVANEWVLARGSTGQLITHTFNYQTGMSDGYAVSNFPAGSSIFFYVDPAIKPGRHLSVGDTVGTISSTDVQERLVALHGQLTAAEASLAVNATGAKSAVVDAARERYDSEKRRREEYQATVTRTQALFNDHVLPQAEYDRVQSTAHSMDDAIAISRAELEAALTGAKPEELALAQARIAELNNEISAINSRAAGYTLRTPIAGTVSQTGSSDVLLKVSTPSPFVALIPVRWSDYARVTAAPDPHVTIVGFSRLVSGKIVAMKHEVETRVNQKVVMATALLDSPPPDLLPGSTARCRIDCAPMTAIAYGRFILHTVATSVEGAAN